MTRHTAIVMVFSTRPTGAWKGVCHEKLIVLQLLNVHYHIHTSLLHKSNTHHDTILTEDYFQRIFLPKYDSKVGW